jgi:UDP-glucose 4,6-dehydratase
MILLLGGRGYVGSAFANLFNSKNVEFRSISRQMVDYTNRDVLVGLIRESGASFLVNAAGYTGKPNVDACEEFKADCLFGNAVLPGIIRDACEHCDLSWGHVSSGCIYTGSRADGGGFTEGDQPNFTFRSNNCSFYSGCKALGEEILQDARRCYIWRLRIPFSHQGSPRNFLSKMIQYDRLLQAENSLSHLPEFVAACFDCVAKRVPFGIYNLTNPGSVTTSEVVEMILDAKVVNKRFRFFDSEQEFMKLAAKTPRSNCVLDSSKAIGEGLQLSPVREILQAALRDWIPAAKSSEQKS